MQKEQVRYSRLVELTKRINMNIELREMLEDVTAAISEEIVHCDSVGIYLPQEDGTFRGYVGKPAMINGRTLDTHIVDLSVDLLAKEVVTTRKTVYIPDTTIDERPDRQAVEGFRIKSLLALPISIGDELYGLVFLFNYGTLMNLTEIEIQVVQSYVNMAAVAIHNANHLIYKENLLAEKQLLLDVTRDLSLCQTMEESIDRCFHYLEKVLHNSNIGIHLLDPLSDKRMRPSRLSKTSDWLEEDWLSTHLEVQNDERKDAVFQEVIRTKEAVIIPNVFNDHRPNLSLCQKFGIRGMCMFPLVSMGEILGVIAVVELEEERLHMKESIRQLAQSIVDATASTLSNLLFMEQQDSIITERTLEITDKNNELERVITELQQLSREKELILNSAGEGIFGLDLHRNITFCNPAGAMMLGYGSKCDIIHRSAKMIFGEAEEKQLRIENFPLSRNRESFTGETAFVRQDGTSLPVEFVISCIYEEGNMVGEVVTFKDITQRKQLEEKIRYHAYYDNLTNLPNRALLKDRLNQGILQAQINDEKLAVLYLDLDRFKLINDSLGHSYGDRLLCNVANRLVKCVPKGATVSRQGGDEFTIILPNIKSEVDVLKVVHYVIDCFVEPFSLVESDIYIKTSIGISLYPENGDNGELLIKNADTAMYKSKEISGNSYHFFSEDMNTRTLETVRLENALYKALDRNQLVLHYQPQIDVTTRSIVGFEALLRWQHPERGLISPDQFIPIAEDTGLIIPIGSWVMQQACKQLKKWQQISGNEDLTISVNLSARQFEQRNLYTNVVRAVEAAAIKPACLHLELTENLIVKNTDMTLETMRELRSYGVRIAVDDFGTGYSSLGYLNRLPIDTLKIDRSFLQDITLDNSHAVIANIIITLAHNLNLSVVAEGVETEEQLQFLMNRNCYLMQGYYFSRPLAATDITTAYFQ